MTSKKNKTVVVIDAGGRGAALVHKYSQSPEIGKIIAIPGNDLLQAISKKPVLTFPDLKTTSVKEIVEIAKIEKADLIDVAQDNAIEAGLVDKLVELGFKVVGPTKDAGQIEWDKSWARDFMEKYNIPSPFYKAFNNKQTAIDFIKENPGKRWFVKASGLAEGKGAIPAENEQQAKNAIEEMSKFGAAGETFVIEEWLEGEEFSMFAISDGKSFQILGSAQDHKRVEDGDRGPNTGGMGCSTPPLIVDNDIYRQAESIIEKAISGLQKEGRPYKGILYLGGIVVGDKVFVIEFNARWGDPEAEVLIAGIENDLLEVSMAVAKGVLDQVKITTDGKSRVAVAATSKGYPIDYSKVKGKEILGLDKLLEDKSVTIYGAGVKIADDKYLANGGRLFYVVGEGHDVNEAREKAYEAIKKVNIEGDNLHFRTDIGYRDVERLTS